MDITPPDDETRLREREADGWQRVKEAMEALEPIVLERITRRVRAHAADAKAIFLEPSDQGGPGWVLESTILSDGSPLNANDALVDQLGDADELTILLLDFGEFVSSETEPYPYEFILELKGTQIPPTPMSWSEFWRLIYARAIDDGEPPEDGANALSAADTCATLYEKDPDLRGWLYWPKADAIQCHGDDTFTLTDVATIA
jgi:hypothetical protein